MSPSSAPASRPSYRPYRAQVQSITQLSTHFVRVSFSGVDFEHFAPHALDQRIKFVFPRDEQSFSELGVDDETVLASGTWYERWRGLDETRRSPLRTYTVRAFDPITRTLHVDFVVHTEAGVPVGPGAQWLSTVQAGEELIIVGPDVRSPDSRQGIDWRPGNATTLLLLGDETAAPAIASILETIPAHHNATALIEVPSSDDALPLDTGSNVRVQYLAREGAPIGALLGPALDTWIAENPATVANAATANTQQLADIDVNTETLWDSPEAQHDGGFYAWIAGESAVIKQLRRTLVTHHKIDRSRVAFMGYWRLGQAERTG